VDFRQLGCTGEDETSRLAIGIVGSLPLSPSDQTRFELAGQRLRSTSTTRRGMTMRRSSCVLRPSRTRRPIPLPSRLTRVRTVMMRFSKSTSSLPVQAEDFGAAQTESEGQIDQRLQRVALNLR
jgi:hypothetical protein